jgi:hypothetical protein
MTVPKFWRKLRYLELFAWCRNIRSPNSICWQCWPTVALTWPNSRCTRFLGAKAKNGIHKFDQKILPGPVGARELNKVDNFQVWKTQTYGANLRNDERKRKKACVRRIGPIRVPWAKMATVLTIAVMSEAFPLLERIECSKYRFLSFESTSPRIGNSSSSATLCPYNFVQIHEKQGSWVAGGTQIARENRRAKISPVTVFHFGRETKYI